MTPSPTTNAKSVPEWAIDRATSLMLEVASMEQCRWQDYQLAFARYIAEHEEAPVDPLAQALSEAFEDLHWAFGDNDVRRVISILRSKGMELAGEQK